MAVRQSNIVYNTTRSFILKHIQAFYKANAHNQVVWVKIVPYNVVWMALACGTPISKSTKFYYDIWSSYFMTHI